MLKSGWDRQSRSTMVPFFIWKNSALQGMFLWLFSLFSWSIFQVTRRPGLTALMSHPGLR